LARATRTSLAILAVVALVGAAVWIRRAPEADLASAPVRGGELVASCRTEPQSFNRLVHGDTPTELIAILTHAKLVRVNRATEALEPWLAESWTRSSDGLTYTLNLRRGIRFSDGEPFTSADVAFSFDTVYNEPAARAVAGGLTVAGQPLAVSTPDAHTVVIRFPAPFGPGLSLLDNLPILPKHRLGPARRDGRFAQAWTTATPPSELAGLGPFVMAEYSPGQRMVFTRNPNYWRQSADGAPLPYLDRVVVQFVPDQNAEVLRLQAGQIDVMVQGEIRPEDYSALKRVADAGRLQLIDVGPSLDPNMLWFNLQPAAAAADPARAWLRAAEFRRAVSHAVDRTAMLNAVFLGAGVPIFGPVTPGNKRWYVPETPRYDYDPARAAAILDGLGLSDRTGDGMREDAAGTPVRFAVLTQRGHTIRERSTVVLQEQLRRVGVAVDVVPLEFKALVQHIMAGDYDAVYFGAQASSTDPANNLDFWLSSGAFHVWHMRQPEPATEWERRIDELMHQQVASSDPGERQRLFAEVQRIFAEQQPALYFVAPRIIVALSPRVANAAPALLSPQVLWSPDTLAVRSGT
jgi:peptide/nickel transport system substrate-binding protein